MSLPITLPPAETLPLVLLLLVLAGSLVGSSWTFVFGASEVEPDLPKRSNYHGYARPSDWPQRGKGATAYDSAPQPRSRLASVVAILAFAILGFGIGSVGLFAWTSPWDTKTDLIHVAAAAHCKTAEALGVAPAAVGLPGYHARLDRDRNGVTCDEAGSGITTAATIPVIHMRKLSDAPMVWPETPAATSEPAFAEAPAE